MILDTSFLIDLMEGERAAVGEAGDLESDGIVQRIPTIVLYELYVGVGYSDRAAAERRRIESVLESRPIEALTPEIAALGGRIDGRMQREGERVAPPDVIVGATARHYGEPVITGNPVDFERLPDVAVRSYQS